jgi:hypothetical protein
MACAHCSKLGHCVTVGRVQINENGIFVGPGGAPLDRTGAPIPSVINGTSGFITAENGTTFGPNGDPLPLPESYPENITVAADGVPRSTTGAQLAHSARAVLLKIRLSAAALESPRRVSCSSARFTCQLPPDGLPASCPLPPSSETVLELRLDAAPRLRARCTSCKCACASGR